MAVRRVRTDSGQDGPDLNDVIREVLLAHFRTTKAFVDWGVGVLGEPKETLRRMLTPQGQWKMDRFSKVLAALEKSPIEFFAMHPDYVGQGTGALKLEKDEQYQRFLSLLTQEERRSLLNGVEELRRFGIFEDIATRLKDYLEIAKKARRKGISDTTPSKPKKS